MQHRFTPILLLFFLVMAGCAANAGLPIHHPVPDQGQQAYLRIKAALSQNEDTIDYDTLVWIHQEMTQHRLEIPNSGELLTSLINKRNHNPRIDYMILVLAADAIGNSQSPIDNIYALFETMMNMDHRINSWVLAYTGDAIGKYPYDIENGDQLADLLEHKASLHTVKSALSKEFFGYHFMPPPRGEYIPNYIAGIQDQQTRVFERNCYYNLIHNQWTEAQIEKALIQLQTHGIPGTGEKTSRPLKYLIQHSDQLLN